MRLAKSIGLILLALSVCAAAAAFDVTQATPTKKAPEKAPAKAAVQAAPQAKAPAKTQAKAPPKAARKAPAKAAAPKKEAPGEPAAEEMEKAAGVARRDPFEPLTGRAGAGGAKPIDPGIPGIGGLVVSTVRVDGVVRAPNGMVAVLTNPQNRVYFVREGARLYDGTVDRISLDGVTFRERGQDPFGKTIERQVVKRIYPRAGEQ